MSHSDIKRFLDKCHCALSYQNKRSLQKSVDNSPTWKESSDLCISFTYWFKQHKKPEDEGAMTFETPWLFLNPHRKSYQNTRIFQHHRCGNNKCKKRVFFIICGHSEVLECRMLRHPVSSEYCEHLLRDSVAPKFCLPEIRHLIKVMKQNQRQEWLTHLNALCWIHSQL